MVLYLEDLSSENRKFWNLAKISAKKRKFWSLKGGKKKKMIYGYLRVSSDEQDVNNQKLGADSLAQAKNFHIDEYIQDEGVSGGKDPSKRKLGPLLEKLQKGDVLICSEISRLGGQLQKRLPRLQSNKLIKGGLI